MGDALMGMGDALMGAGSSRFKSSVPDGGQNKAKEGALHIGEAQHATAVPEVLNVDVSKESLLGPAHIAVLRPVEFMDIALPVSSETRPFALWRAGKTMHCREANDENRCLGLGDEHQDDCNSSVTSGVALSVGPDVNDSVCLKKNVGRYGGLKTEAITRKPLLLFETASGRYSVRSSTRGPASGSEPEKPANSQNMWSRPKRQVSVQRQLVMPPPSTLSFPLHTKPVREGATRFREYQHHTSRTRNARKLQDRSRSRSPYPPATSATLFPSPPHELGSRRMLGAV